MKWTSHIFFADEIERVAVANKYKKTKLCVKCLTYWFQCYPQKGRG